ncbi:MAG: HAD family phosphatase [Candidatus Falkowbacteria bacterium]
MKYGFIFDLDGTLIDTQLLFHAKAESIIFSQHGLNFEPAEISARYAGISTRKIFEDLLPQQDADRLVRQKWEIMDQLVRINPPIALPGMLEVCRFLKSRSIPIIIASASPRSWIKLCLGQPVNTNNRCSLNLLDVFGDNYVSAEECENGKPAPDVFLLGKDTLAIPDPDNVIDWTVVGDGESDVAGGLAAGMKVLFLSNDNKSFDTHPNVKRFPNSIRLANHIKDLVAA